MRNCFHPRVVWTPWSTWMECVGRLNRRIQLKSIWNVVANASHDHDPLSVIGLEVGDGASARHNLQKYQMVKHQSLVWSNEHPDQNSHMKCHCTENVKHVSGYLLSTENCLAIGKAWFRRPFVNWIPPTMDIGLRVVSRSLVNRWWWW